MTEKLKPCPDCNGTGDIVDFLGEWRGYCRCGDGSATEITAADIPEEVKREVMETAHMAGQADAGVDPSWSNAQAYATLKLKEQTK
jgi:hypothetical protein